MYHQEIPVRNFLIEMSKYFLLYFQCSPPHCSDHHRASSKSVRDRNQQQRYLISDSSSCGGYESAESEKDIVILASEQIHALELQPRQQQRRSTAQHQQQEHHVSPTSMTSSSAGGATTTSTSIYSSTNMEPSKSSSSTTKKKSFWQLLTGKKSSKKCVSWNSSVSGRRIFFPTKNKGQIKKMNTFDSTVCLNFEVSPCCCCQIAYLNNLMWMLVSKIDFICLIGRPQNRFLKYYVLCWIEVAAEAALLSLRKCNVV